MRGVHGLVRCGAVLAQGAALIAILGVESSTGVAADCPASDDVAILASPRAPVAGRELRVFAASAAPIDGQLVVRAPDGSVAASASHAPGAAPSAFEKQRWRAEVAAPVAGMYRAEVVRGRDVVACSAIRVNGSEMPRRARPGGVVWPVEREWSPAEEALYAAWVEHLFDDPLDAEPSWHGIGDVLQDPDRNFLYDHLGLDEDADRRLRFQPDCADLPFFLRAYFAWKLGLPFGYSECSRGGPSSPPRCAGWHSSVEARGDAGDDVGAFSTFVRRDVGWSIHSGSARTPANDDRSDLYPIRIAPETVTPGTVYADPYGHTLVVVRRLPQTESSGGILLAVDAQPDGTVARKRYWRGNFLFAVDPALGGAGFKHFRPIAGTAQGLRRPTNAELAADRDGDFSLEQYGDGVDGFYDRVDDLLSPAPLDPALALRQTIDALEEQTRTRVKSVDNGVEYVASHPGVIAMPAGAAIFETSGAWEDFATPARDLRLLIALDVVQGFPAQVARRPERYVLGGGRSAADVRRELAGVLERETAARRFAYRASDGSERSLSLADLFQRSEALEVAYNPNDCIEVRWGAAPGSAEAATCRRRAPRDQAARMEQYRPWFHERRRPPRP
ncbi:MAG TPA: hypothetical protein VFD92_02205 [Candidatus Binatia bacterium]|nr:hypothetical protein [Candidatus Binatia bacterium]